MKKLRSDTKFLNLKVPVFVNKKNGQLSITIPRKRVRHFLNLEDYEADETFPKRKRKEIKISIWQRL